MKKILALTVFFSGLLTACASQQAAANKKLILLTSFEPFENRSVNLSQVVAEQIVAHQSEISDDVEVRVCNLPVVYDAAAQKAQECFDRLERKPEMVVSLGEGSCILRLETSATNLDRTPMADNAGQLRQGTPIVSEGEPRAAFPFPVEEMFCEIPEAYRKWVGVSVSTGNYVCNNTAYHLSRYFKQRRIPYTFVHVPHSDCSAEVRDPELNAQILTKMLRRVDSYLKSKVAIQTIPVSTGEAKARYFKLAQENARSCEKDFLKQLMSQYSKAQNF